MTVAARLRGAFAAAGVVLVLLMLNLQLLEARRSAGRRIGVVIEGTSDGVALASVTPESPAARAGLAPGDLVIAVGEVLLRHARDYDEAAKGFARGTPVTYHVARDGVRLDVVVTPGMPVAWLTHIGMGVVALGYLVLALLTLAQPQRDLRGTLLFAFSMAVALEVATPTAGVGNPTLDLVAWVSYFLLSGLEIGLELHLVSLIPARHAWLHRRPWVVPGYYVVGLSIGVLLAATRLAEHFELTLFPWTFAQAENAFYIAIMPLWALAVTAILGFSALTLVAPLGRHQAALVLLADLPWVVLTLTSAGSLLLTDQSPSWFELAEPPVLLAFPVFVFIAVFRYQLFDIELVVRRSMVYLALTGSLVLVFYAAVGAGSALLSQWVGGSVPVLVFSATTLLVGLLFSPLHRALQRFISRRFFPERFAQRQRLIDLAAELPAYGKVPLMGKHLVTQLAEIFATRSATVLVAEPEGGVLVTVASSMVSPERDFDQSFLLSPDDPGVVYLKRVGRPLPAPQVGARSASMAQRLAFFDAALVVPVMTHDTLIGMLLLSDKEAGGGYLGEETELLSLLSHHVASVLENARLFESATTDNLTGLLRRETVIAHLDHELQRAIRYRRPLAVGMADLDHFKEINDRHGHLVGDSVLKRVAQAITSGLRSADLVGRYGGEEFLFVLPESDLEGARVVAEKIRRAVAEIRQRMDDNTTLTVTLSIGLTALADDGDGERAVQGLIAAADRNLLRAKAAGRDRVEG